MWRLHKLGNVHRYQNYLFFLRRPWLCIKNICIQIGPSLMTQHAVVHIPGQQVALERQAGGPLVDVKWCSVRGCSTFGIAQCSCYSNCRCTQVVQGEAVDTDTRRMLIRQVAKKRVHWDDGPTRFQCASPCGHGDSDIDIVPMWTSTEPRTRLDSHWHWWRPHRDSFTTTHRTKLTPLSAVWLSLRPFLSSLPSSKAATADIFHSGLDNKSAQSQTKETRQAQRLNYSHRQQEAALTPPLGFQHQLETLFSSAVRMLQPVQLMCLWVGSSMQDKQLSLFCNWITLPGHPRQEISY